MILNPIFKFNGRLQDGVDSSETQLRASVELITRSKYLIDTSNGNLQNELSMIMAVNNITVSHEPASFSLLDGYKEDTDFPTAQDTKLKQMLETPSDKFPLGDPSVLDTQSQLPSNFYEADDEFTSDQKERFVSISIPDYKQFNMKLANYIALPKVSNSNSGANQSTNKYFSRLKKKKPSI